MAEYITDLQVSLNEIQESELREQGYNRLDGDLNTGTDGKNIYIWYKIGTGKAITRIQFSFNDIMAKGLSKAGYSKIAKNLNEGTDGDTIYLWYFKGSLESDVPITDLAVALTVADEVANYKAGYQRLACDLKRNAGGNNQIYLFVNRAKSVYISAIDASDNAEKDVVYFQSGYIRVDECTNRGAGGNSVFIWYLLTTDDKQALNSPLQISINAQEYQNYQSQGYTPVNQSLNLATNVSVFLWYKKDGQGDPISDMSVIFKVEMDPFEEAGINVINKNLKVGQAGLEEYVCFC